MTKHHFHVINGTPAPDTPQEQTRKRVKGMPRPASMIQCHRCGGREVIEAKTGVMLKNGKPTGGTRQLLCVACLLNGQRVVIG